MGTEKQLLSVTVPGSRDMGREGEAVGIRNKVKGGIWVLP